MNCTAKRHWNKHWNWQAVFLPAAAVQHIEVQRLAAHEKRTMLSLDLGNNGDSDSLTRQLTAFKVQDGDQIHIFPSLRITPTPSTCKAMSCVQDAIPSATA